MPKNILINSTLTQVPDNINTINDLLEWKNIPFQGTAVALNGKLITAKLRELTQLKDLDSLMIIRAAYGG